MSRLFVGIDLGGTQIKAGVIENGRVTGRSSLFSGSAAGLRQGLAPLRELVNDLAGGRKIDAIGLAMPGIVDQRSRRLTAINGKWSDATEIDLTEWAAEGWDAPLVMDNDAVAALAGEWQFGAGMGADGVVMMTLGTGIGVAAVVDGRLLRGSHGQAAIGGHITVMTGGRLCTCGNRGCAEAEASTFVLTELARSDPRFSSSALASAETIDYTQVFLHSGTDPLCRDLRDRSLTVWSALAVSLIHAYDPEVLIIGGGVASAGAPLIGPIDEYVQRHAWSPWGSVQVRRGECGSDAALLGICAITDQYIWGDPSGSPWIRRDWSAGG